MSLSPFPAFGGTEVIVVAFMDGSSFGHSPIAFPTRRSRQMEKKKGLGIAARCRAGAADAICLYELCFGDCPALRHGVEKSLMARVAC